MVYEDLSQKKQEEDAVLNNGGSSPISSSSAPIQPGQSQQMPAQRGTSNRPNVRQYLEANKNAGQQISSGIQQKSEEQAGQISQGIKKAGEQFQSKANPLAQEVGDVGSQRIQTAFKDPSSILKNQQQLEQFQKLRQQGATGDIRQLSTQGQELANPLAQQVGKLATQAQNAGTEMGRYDLLRQSFGQPQYSRGQQKLDQLFLQGSGNSARDLQNQLKGIQSNVGNQLNQFTGNIEKTAADLNTAAQARAKQIQDLFSGGTSADALESDLSQRGLSDIEANNQAQMAQAKAAMDQVPGLRERLAQNALTESDMSALGLSAGQKIYNTDLSSYLNQSDISPTAAGVSTPEELARYRALESLAGTGRQDIFGTAQEAGTYKPYQFDQARLAADLKSKDESVSNLIKQAQDTGSNFIDTLNSWNRVPQSSVSQELQQNLPDLYRAIQNLKQNPTVDALQNYFTEARKNIGGWAGTSENWLAQLNPNIASNQKQLDYILKELLPYQTDRVIGGVQQNNPKGYSPLDPIVNTLPVKK